MQVGADARHRLLGIQLARGIAALIVVVYHGGRMLSLDQYVGFIPLYGLFNFGHAGVDFFFVLSGFIIYFVHAGDIGRRHRLLRYAWRRLTRIYPTYWLVTAMVLAILLLKGQADAVQLDHLLKSLLLLHHDREPLLSVAWTLEHEMLFYCVFGLAILSARIAVVAGAAWLGLILYGNLHGNVATLDHGVLGHAASLFNLQFLMGIVAAHVVRQDRVPAPRLVLLAGVLGFLSVGLLENTGVIQSTGSVSKLLFGAAATVTVIGLASAERRGLLRVSPLGEFLGGASYSLYLVHLISVGATAKLLVYLGLMPLLPGWMVLALAVLASVAAAGLIFKLVEQPVLNVAGQVLRKPSPVVVGSTASR